MPWFLKRSTLVQVTLEVPRRKNEPDSGRQVSKTMNDASRSRRINFLQKEGRLGGELGHRSDK